MTLVHVRLVACNAIMLTPRCRVLRDRVFPPITDVANLLDQLSRDLKFVQLRQHELRIADEVSAVALVLQKTHEMLLAEPLCEVE